MKQKLYDILVNRYPGINERYHNFCKNTSGKRRGLSWLYLLYLNFCFYVLQIRSLGRTKAMNVYEEKKLETKESETKRVQKDGITVQSVVNYLSGYDVISFDIFDTLIFRPFSEPADLFYFLGEKLGRMNFKELRKQMERDARKNCFRENGHYEVTLEDIWREAEEQMGCSAEQGIREEIAMEKRFCYANSFMLEVCKELQRCKKKMIVVSDMYLPGIVLEDILKKNGYDCFEKVYVSCDYKKSKMTGDLYELVSREHLGRIVHVGDNQYSDIEMAKKHRWNTCYYPNVNQCGNKYRPNDMSSVIGSAYRGLVNAYLYRRTEVYSKEYEYGFIYGGLFVTGYCSFVREYCKRNNIDKVLFLSRDGEILKKAYDILFPEENSEYVYWSRCAATKLMAKDDKQDYFRRFLFHKVNKGISLEKAFSVMGTEALLDDLPVSLRREDALTSKNVKTVKLFLEDRWENVLAIYEEEHRAAKAYYTKALEACKRAVAVDVGWAGSGALSMNHLVQEVWGIPCDITGIIAGTNTIHNTEPDATEIFLQSGRLVAYLFSPSHNRDLLKKHNPNRGYNIYWEVLLSSPTPQFTGFGTSEKGEWELRFGKQEENQKEICDLQNGILAFVKEYKRHFGDIPYMCAISGRDAYAPMLLGACKKEKYLKWITKEFSLEIDV